MLAREKAAPRAVPATPHHESNHAEDSAFSPQNPCFPPKNTGVEQSCCGHWGSRRSWHPGQGWSWEHPRVTGHAVPTHPHLPARGATLALRGG